MPHTLIEKIDYLMCISITFLLQIYLPPFSVPYYADAYTISHIPSDQHNPFIQDTISVLQHWGLFHAHLHPLKCVSGLLSPSSSIFAGKFPSTFECRCVISFLFYALNSFLLGFFPQ